MSRVGRKVRKVVGHERTLDGTSVHVDCAVQNKHEPAGFGLRRAADCKIEVLADAPLHTG